MSEPGDSSDGKPPQSGPSTPTDTELAALAAPLPLYRARTAKKSGSITEPTFLPSANAKGWGSAPQGVAFRTGNRRGAERDLRRREATTIRDFTAGPCGSLPASCTGSIPLRELKTGRKPSFSMSVSANPPGRCTGAETLHSVRTRPTCFSNEPQRGITPGTVRSLVRWR